MRRLLLLTSVVVTAAAFAQPPREAKTVHKRPETADPAVRCVLEGVPWIGFYGGNKRGPEDDPFPACVRAFLEYRNENLGLKPRSAHDPWHVVHVYIKGACGASFRIGWDPNDRSWRALELLGMAGDPLTTFRSGLEAAGYSCEILLRKDFARSLGLAQDADYDEAIFRERIITSVRRGVPVIGLGVVGPPEACLITGYDAGGDVLVGRSFFQDEPAEAAQVELEEAGGGVPDPYFRRRGWFADTRGLILIGDKIERPSDHAINVQALRRALEIMRTPVVQGHWTGQAAFTMWADTLLKSEPFPADDLATLKRRHEYHHSVGGTLAEGRAYAADFLRRMADAEPAAAEELREAAQCFDDEHDLVWAIWEFTGGMSANEEGARKFGNAFLRGRLVPLARLCRRRDAEAAAHIARALDLMGDKPADPETPGNFGRLVLQDVPKIGYGIHLCPFPGSLYAVMQYLGDPVEYDYLMGITGAAFRRAWNRDDGGNVDLGYFAPEVYRHAAFGLQYELRPVPRDQQKMLAAVRESLSRGRPVIAFGIVGPPEAGLVTGYSQGGEVLHGWSYHQGGKWPGMYEQDDWFAGFKRFEQSPDGGLGPIEKPAGLLVVGDKNRWREGSARDVLVESLRWAVDLERTAQRPSLPQHICGLAAYEAWAKALEVDADYPAGNKQVLETRAMVHCDQVVMLHERSQAAKFLRRMAGQVPEVADDLNAAAALYDEVGPYAGQVWKWGHWMQPEAQQGLADPAQRREFAAAIRAAAAKEAEAVAQLEAILQKLEAAAPAQP